MGPPVTMTAGRSTLAAAISSPGVVLFENYLLYEYVVAFLLLASAALLLQLVRGKRAGYLFFATLLLLMLVRNFFHLVYLLAVFAAVLCFCKRRAVLLSGVMPLLLVLTAIALVTYVAWQRCRYFGNTAPLLALLVLTALGLVTIADVFVGPFPFRATPFLYIFVAGVFADLLESRWRYPAGLLLLGVSAAYAMVSIMAVARLRASVPH
jgi:hypothetical protein